MTCTQTRPSITLDFRVTLVSEEIDWFVGPLARFWFGYGSFQNFFADLMEAKRVTRSQTVKRGRSTTRSRSRSSSRARAMPGRSTAVASISKGVGVGLSTNTILRTSFFANVTGTAGTGVFTGFLKPGSCFDPCGDLAAIQPQMFDQFAAMYSRYLVNSCVVRMKITGSLGTTVWVAAAYPSVDSTALSTYQAAASQQYAKTTSGAFQGLQASTSLAGAEGKYLSFNLDHNKIVGAKSDTWDIGAPVTADPTTGQFMVLPIFLQGNASGAHTWVLEIDMWQNVTFSQKKNTVDA